MGFPKTSKLKYWMVFIIVFLIIVGGPVYYTSFYTPKNSLELYQDISFAEDFEKAQKLMLKGYEANFQREDYEYIYDTAPNRIGQFTLFEYSNKTYIVMTTPGTDKLEVLAVEELPEEIREYFFEVAQ